MFMVEFYIVIDVYFWKWGGGDRKECWELEVIGLGFWLYIYNRDKSLFFFELN